MYDNQNVFAKILRGEIPCNKVYEDEYALAFYDAAPRAKTHVLVIPKGEYKDFHDFTTNAPAESQEKFWNAVKATADELKLKDFRLVTNNGSGAGQVVFHLHVHIMAD